MSDLISEISDSITERYRSVCKTMAVLQPHATLLAVSKQQPAEKIRVLLEMGHLLFAENRVQEAMQKWPALKHDYPDVKLHLIGPLQTNKVREAVAFFDVIHSLDRPSLAIAIAKECARLQKAIPCLVQVNTGEEPQKAGILPKEAPAFIEYCRKDLSLSIKGLMCIPPVQENPAPHFGLLHVLAKRHQLEWLSMGMSEDYETALLLGATHIRLGSVLFGKREDNLSSNR